MFIVFNIRTLQLKICMYPQTIYCGRVFSSILFIFSKFWMQSLKRKGFSSYLYTGEEDLDCERENRVASSLCWITTHLPRTRIWQLVNKYKYMYLCWRKTNNHTHAWQWLNAYTQCWKVGCVVTSWNHRFVWIVFVDRTGKNPRGDNAFLSKCQLA